jgi:hypothetical protein
MCTCSVQPASWGQENSSTITAQNSVRLRRTVVPAACAAASQSTRHVHTASASEPRSDFGQVATHCTQLKISPAGQPKAQLSAACGNPCYHLLGGCPHLSAPRDKPFSTPFNPRAIWRAAVRNTPQPCCCIACTLAVLHAALAPPRTAKFAHTGNKSQTGSSRCCCSKLGSPDS